MNPNKALWEKGDFTRIAESMRESGEALVQGLGDHERARGPGSRLRRRHDRVAGGAASARTCWASTSRATSSRPGTGAPRTKGLTNCRFQEGDASDLHDLSDRLVRPRREHLRRHVRTEAVRRGQGDGARDPARRSDRHGQLDPQRPDAGRADLEDQLRVLAAAAGGLRQPDDVGDREPTSSSDSPAREFRTRRSRSPGTRTPSTSRATVGARRGRSARTTGRR